MSSAGNPRGAGRKPSPPELKKIPVGVKLPRWLVDWLRAQDEPAAQLIEDALRRRHKLKPPDAGAGLAGFEIDKKGCIIS